MLREYLVNNSSVTLEARENESAMLCFGKREQVVRIVAYTFTPIKAGQDVGGNWFARHKEYILAHPLPCIIFDEGRLALLHRCVFTTMGHPGSDVTFRAIVWLPAGQFVTTQLGVSITQPQTHP